MNIKRNEAGYSIAELLVGMLMFSVLGAGMVQYMVSAFDRMGTEYRASVTSTELSDALSLMTSELRMSASLSPYLPGNNPDLVNCGAQIQVTPTTLKFLVVHDDGAATGGMQAYYVGYRYDAAAKQLLRGAIAAPSYSSCALPGGDPTSLAIAHPIASDIVAIDSDDDGAVDQPFEFAPPQLQVNLGALAKGTRTSHVTQHLTSNIVARVL